MLRRVLLAALLCLAVWASEQPSGAVTDPSTADLHSFDGHTRRPARSTDVWQSAGAVVAVQARQLHGHAAETPAPTLSSAPRVRHATAPAFLRPPPAAPHTFELPLLI